jgi:UDP-glucose 4-epimerase
MKVLVTGGAGFIGSNLIKLLTEEGCEITVIDNFLSGYRCNLDPFPAVNLIEGDIRDPAAVARAMQGVEAIFHFAASVGNKRSIEHPIDDAEINVIGTLQLLEAARKAGVRKIVYSSSAGIFGELKTLPIKEDHPIEPDSPYGSTKLAAEKLCLTYAKLYEIEAICLRYFNVYGVNQRFDAYGNAIPIFAHRALNGETITIFDDGEQTRDIINVRDVVQANYKAALNKGTSGAFNVASGTRITINKLVELICEAGNLQAKIEYGPPRPGDVRHSLADISAVQEALGLEITVGLEEGMQEYMAWAKVEMAGK